MGYKVFGWKLNTPESDWSLVRVLEITGEEGDVSGKGAPG
jgi:hypothetical protein